MTPYQFTCVALEGGAILIEGQPGIGKSSLALALIDRGATMVGDDGVLLEARGGRLFAHPHPNTRGLIEIRGLGLLTTPVADSAAVALMVRLKNDAPRFIEAPEVAEVQGIRIPAVDLFPDTPVLHLRAEMALRHYGLSVG